MLCYDWGMKVQPAPTFQTAERPPRATPTEVLAYETTRDEVVLYGPDGRSLSPQEATTSPSGGRLKNLLLPSKMPDSVSPDYLASRKWNFLGEMAGASQSYLGTAAALSAVGIGNGPLTVGLAWMLRDGIDGVGKFVGSQFGRQADRNPKGWTMTGEAIQSVGLMVESSLAVAPQAFLATATSANAIKAMGSTLKGAAQAPIEVHQARDNNLGEVRSKNANQSMLASSIGGVVGFGLEKLGNAVIGGAATPLLMAAATATRLFATHRYVQSLDLETVTESKVHKQLQKWADAPRGCKLGDLQLGAPLSELLESPERFRQLTEVYAGENYLLELKGEAIQVVFHEDAGPEDQLQAVAQASLLRYLQASPSYQRRVATSEGENCRDWLLETSLAASRSAESGLSQGSQQPLRFEVEPRRAHWEKLRSHKGPSLNREGFRQLLR